MREVVFIKSLLNGVIYGVGTYLNEIIFGLQKSGVKVTVVELGFEIPEFIIADTEGIKRLSFPFSPEHATNFSWRVASLLKLHIKDSPNLIFHFNFSTEKELIEQVKTKFPESKIVFTVHFFDWSVPFLGDADRYRQFIASMDEQSPQMDVSLRQFYINEKEVFEKVDAIIALSDDTSSLLTDTYGIPRGKIFRMVNGLRDACDVPNNRKDILRKQFHIGLDEIVLLFVGRLDPVKGVSPLLTSFRKIVSKYDNCRLVLIGDGYISTIEGHHDIMSKVILTGKIAREEVYKWYAIADIGAFPSLYEECSYVGIEMMMHSLPVVASDGYSVKNMFHDGQNALVAKRGYTKDNRDFEENLFHSVSRLIESEELRDQIAAGGRKSYEEIYSAHIMHSNYKHLLDNL